MKQSPVPDFPNLRLRYVPLPDYTHELQLPNGIPVATQNFSAEDKAWCEAAARRLANCWNACSGLSVASSVPPGAVLQMVTVLSLLQALSRGEIERPLSERTGFRRFEAAFQQLGPILDAFDVVTPPIPPP